MWELQSLIETDVPSNWMAEGHYPLTRLDMAVKYANELRRIYAKHGCELRCRVVYTE